MSWIRDVFDPQQRTWEDFYRHRWSYDKVVRSTHGVNCTGSCSWNIHVKNGIVTWEMQALDYPVFDRTIPPYEPRGCQRGISYSWYIYSPLRVKYPLMRGALLDLWRDARREHPSDPVAAWKSVVSNPSARRRYQEARGKGGFRRVSWDEVEELLAAANLHTVKEHGSDRIAGFSPIPAMSMVSYAAGARLMQLLGGVSLSFYDWYCDLPPASPEIWGEQTDVAESADWYHSDFIAVVGSNVLMTRTPDAHYLVEARHRGTKVVVFSPDFSQTSKVADEWIPIHQGQDGAFWMAVVHVMLKEAYVDRQVESFEQYLKVNTDAPFLVRLEEGAGGTLTPRSLLRASEIADTEGEDQAEWKSFVMHEDGCLALPPGTVGHRWQEKKGEWNIGMTDSRTGDEIQPVLQLGELADEVVPVAFSDFTDGSGEVMHRRGVPCKVVETSDGPVKVTTVFELMLSQYGVDRGLEGSWPDSYQDEHAPYTPAWQERFTGISADNLIQFAREWTRTAELSGGRCSIIIGAGVNHWYHNNLIYRSAITALMLGGCIGKQGGGWNHYVGQEKLAPQSSWAPIAFAGDWGGPPRHQNTPSFHYMNSDQWRYDRPFREMCPVAEDASPITRGHTADKQVQAVRNGWLPCYPQFTQSNHEVVREAREHGAKDDADVVARAVERLKGRSLKFAMEDPDDPACWPRLFYIWRGNALLSSAKGHEYFLKHYLGTHHNAIAEEEGRGQVEEVAWHEKVDTGKMDLVVDLNFRMDSSALYSDIVLPAATYYEKNDLNSTDMHTFIHPLQAAVPPCWESRSDWDIFKGIAKKTAELAEKSLPQPLEDLVATPLAHDTPDEVAQPAVRSWIDGECEAVPGKTMPHLKVVRRDYTDVYRKFISLGPQFRNAGLGMHGTKYPADDVYDSYLEDHPVQRWGGGVYPSLERDREVCDVILHFAAETNGELAYRAYEAESKKTGRDHRHLAEKQRSVRYSFDDVCNQPRRLLTTPFWTGVTNGKRTYAAFCQNVEERIPWRTLTGRQHFYLDHEAYVAYGEHLPTFKPRPETAEVTRDLVQSRVPGDGIVLNYLTPHGKWHIHSTFGDTLRMETLSRGLEPVWMNDKDASLLGIEDNDWVEMYNDHGVVCTRACVSARVPRGLCMIYHSPERTLSVPKSPERGDRRAGGHNSLTRVRLKPLFMIGGYAQFTYAFNYWGPTGVNRDTYVVIKKLDRLEW